MRTRTRSPRGRVDRGVGGAVMVTVGVLLVIGQWVRVLSPVLRAVNRFTPAI